MPDPLPPEAPVARVTLSRNAIISAKALMIAITGQQKRDVLEAAIAEGASSSYPAGRILADVELPLDVRKQTASLPFFLALVAFGRKRVDEAPEGLKAVFELAPSG